MNLPIQRLDPDLPLPAVQRPGDAGIDLRSRVDLTLAPGERALVPTGVALAIPAGHAGLVLPRSGLALRAGVTVLNSPGLIDSGYRGEIKVVLVNTDPREPVRVARGDRVAQLVVLRVETADLVPVDALPDSARGAAGFGSTGA